MKTACTILITACTLVITVHLCQKYICQINININLVKLSGINGPSNGYRWVKKLYAYKLGEKNPITANFVILMCEVPVKLISLLRRLAI